MDLLSHEAGLKRDCFIENVPVSVGQVREVSKEACFPMKVVLKFGYLRAECPLMRIRVNLNFIITNVLAAWPYSP